MWKTERALDERIEYAQLAPQRWRATYRGFIAISAEGLDPRNAQLNLNEAFDLLLANLIRSTHRPVVSEADADASEPGLLRTTKAGVRRRRPR